LLCWWLTICCLLWPLLGWIPLRLGRVGLLLLWRVPCILVLRAVLSIAIKTRRLRAICLLPWREATCSRRSQCACSQLLLVVDWVTRLETTLGTAANDAVVRSYIRAYLMDLLACHKTVIQAGRCCCLFAAVYSTRRDERYCAQSIRPSIQMLL
jgi:hypothetical protein